MRGKVRPRTLATWVALSVAMIPLSARSDTPRRQQTADRDLAALRSEVAEQRELILKLTEMEGAHYEYLLKLIHSLARSGKAGALPPGPPASSDLPPSALAPPSSSSRK